ncbi:assimilatory sulfite reductase (NADPH) flavoprotein subunit [Thiofilum flexile]|uniref:assimilatory sulfite reductase (NADPH) flavoprotein subunit n=1 Tax=Thiofilum flexile TaxID=125627 RepID=UPI00037E227B|nr:assimilatory sulfite reductase (NADPH) flavoprotein subunit [Thiofilum flexile]
MVLSEQQLQQVTNAISGLSPTQLAWLGGYFSGLSQTALVGQVTQTTPAANLTTALTATVLYGTQTGNSKKVATELQAALQAKGVTVTLSNIKDYRPQNLKKETRLYVVVSTQGNGEPPDEARAFYKFLQDKRAPRLEQLEYSVLALGDSSYEEFCQAGVLLDARLAELGAKPIVKRTDCDVDFAEPASSWQQAVIEQLPAAPSNVVSLRPNAVSAQVAQATDSFFAAEVLNRVSVTASQSDKDVYHIEFSLEDSGLSYAPGDILVVKTKNNPEFVAEFIQALGLDSSATVTTKTGNSSFAEALQERELTSLTRKQLKAYAELIGNETLVAELDAKADFEWLTDADWIDVVGRYPSTLSAQQWIDLLRVLQPRQYSIASSPSAHTDEVHLLIKRVEYTHLQRLHRGSASNALAQVELGDKVEIQVKPNAHFKLPQDPNTKVIMIGAGTGVAPFRSFLFEREAQGITGNTWLFFGEQRFRTDFLYQVEWQALLKSGALEKMSVAFSRDQTQKIYVQQRITENASAVYEWLQSGAHIYVCGDMNKMAKDVHQALVQVLVSAGKQSVEEAQNTLEQWISDGRYQRDVY